MTFTHKDSRARKGLEMYCSITGHVRDLFKPLAAQIVVYFRLFINGPRICNGFTFMEEFLKNPDLSLQFS